MRARPAAVWMTWAAALSCLLLPGEARSEQEYPPAEIIGIWPKNPTAGDAAEVVVKVKEPDARQSVGLVVNGKEVSARRQVEGARVTLEFDVPEEAAGSMEIRAAVGAIKTEPYAVMVAPSMTAWMPGGTLSIGIGVGLIALSLGGMFWRSSRKAKAAAREAREALKKTQTKTAELERLLVEQSQNYSDSHKRASQGSALAGSGRALTPAAGVPQVFPKGEVPDPPEDLVRALASGECVLYAGAGLGAQAGYPTWPTVLKKLLEQVLGPAESPRPNPLVAKNEAELGHIAAELWMRHRRGQWSAVAEFLRTQVDRQKLLEATRGLFPEHPLPPAHELLGQLPFAGAITSSWDSLLSRTFHHRRPAVASPRDPEGAVKAYAQREFFLVQLFGQLDGSSFVFSNDEYRELMSTSPLSRFVASVVTGRTFLFLGASVDGLETVFSDLRLGEKTVNQQTVTGAFRRHYALVPDEPEWAAAKYVFRTKYGVECLTYRPTSGHGEVAEFLHRLHKRVFTEHRKAADATLAQATRLRAVRLTNIGSFPTLELMLNEGWNVLLGNNGCGKTTLLRAIALGLCGDDPKAAPAARWLLSAGQSQGSIELEVGTNVFRTELLREGDRIRVISRLLTPLQTGGWVVLGFPPLRGVSTREPKGPVESGTSGPTVDDLLPLLLGGVDDRLDSVKQWIVNEYLRAGRKRSQRLDDFFDILRDLTPGLHFDFHDVEPDSFRVLMKVEDGAVVPLDRLSQGMSSVHGWVGTLLQRMHEIRDGAAKRAQEAGRPAPPPAAETPALVLVDEVDAHLHPEWQQKLVGLVRKRFPNVQIIVTTHSPLVISDLDREEIFTADRGQKGSLCVVRAKKDVRGRRADQILISLFGLKRTRASTRYVELSERALHGPPLSEAEQRELDQLREAMEVHGSETEKRVSVAVKQALGRLKEEVGNAPLAPEEQEEVHRQLSRLFGKPGDGAGGQRR